ncbi:hypothetical protein AB0D11_35265 [Streptomyces monashensis]|uniref:hypothetical protein n=1 Tax=Streptomyces monashensis TaxID=1678012 RepID=UPI00340FB5A6
MPKPIRLALERTLALLLALLVPATGRRRRRNHSAPAPALATAVPPKTRARARIEAEVLLDDPSPLIRPYLLDHERREEQQERRAALVLALDGIDIGPWVIHGHRVGTPVTPLGVAA